MSQCVRISDYDDEGDQASMSNDALYNAMRNFEKAQEDDERERAQALNAMDARYDPNLKNLVEEGEDGIMSESVETKYDDYGAKVHRRLQQRKWC